VAIIAGLKPEPVSLDAVEGKTRLRQGVYLITGGMGMGLVLAQYLAQVKAKLVLVGRSGLPAKAVGAMAGNSRS